MKPYSTAIFAVISSVVLTSCVSVPQKTESLSSDLTTRELATLLLDTAQKCWARKETFFRDGIVVGKMASVRGIAINAFRHAYDIPNQPSFLIITINDGPGGGSSVEVEEGDYAAGSYLNLTSDVKRWVAGDLTCKT